jgi:hypothetical protein
LLIEIASKFLFSNGDLSSVEGGAAPIILIINNKQKKTKIYFEFILLLIKSTFY